MQETCGVSFAHPLSREIVRAKGWGTLEIGYGDGVGQKGWATRHPPSPKIPFAPTYFPGTTDVHSAEKLSIEDGQHRTVLLGLTERLQERRVPVKVTWPDGKPVEDANVWLAETNDPTTVVGTAVSHTNSKGTFTLIGFDGVDYFVHANIYVKPDFKPFCAEKALFRAADPTPQAIVFTLTITGDVCRSSD